MIQQFLYRVRLGERHEPKNLTGGLLQGHAHRYSEIDAGLAVNSMVFGGYTIPDAPCMEYLPTFGSFLG